MSSESTQPSTRVFVVFTLRPACARRRPLARCCSAKLPMVIFNEGPYSVVASTAELYLASQTLDSKRLEGVQMIVTNGRNGKVTLSEKGLLTPDNCVLALIDHQPQMLFGVANFDRQDVINKTLALAKAARIFDVPTVLSTVETKSF